MHWTFSSRWLVFISLSLVSCGGGGGDGNLAPAPSDPSINFTVPREFSALTFNAPVALRQAPGDGSRWFVVEQDGVVRVFANNSNVTTSSVFIDIGARVTSPADGGGSETGLLGIAFHPSFPATPRVYLYYTATVGQQLVARVAEFRSTDNGATLDPTTETILLTINKPESNHNGGNLLFGSDGFLYIGVGDGGGSGDAHGSIGNAQNLQTLLGKMLRIDVNNAAPGFNYAIPSSNPFATGRPLCGTNGTGTQECPEIYAYGFRNPWRWSFDRDTGELWVGDVGQSSWEEIDKVTLGGNYGWRCREGAHDFNLSCGSAQNLIAPIAEYGRAAGFSTMGGYVYRGTAISALRGRYVFGDFGGRLWHIARDTTPTRVMTAAEGFDTGLQISSFAEDANGELLIVNYGGTIHRLAANP